MDRQLDISVILCTYNRCQSLRRTLETFEAVHANSINWELIIVDNNSNDLTKTVCSEFASRLPLRYVFEPSPGKSYALENGLSHAKGQLLLFTDDDVDIDPNWLVEWIRATRANADAMFFGGKVVPRWEVAPPRWLDAGSRGVLRAVMLHHDRGPAVWKSNDSRQNWEELHRYPFPGANFALRSNVLPRYQLSFRKDLGPRSGEGVRGEEMVLQQHLLDKAAVGAYVPSAVVYHRNAKARMTLAYVRKWFRGEGRAAVRIGDCPASTSNWFGAPRYLWRQLIASAVSLALTRPFCAPTTWLRYECQLASKWGSICEFRDRQNSK
jgi:glycosyltransferase involved in cell wall biosynthesis